MMQKRTLTGLIFLFLLGFASPLWAQSTVQYVYDALGRLTQVIDPSGNVATYNYDAVGNLLSITRSTTSPSSLAIFSFSPAQGAVGQTVTIQGQNFSTTPSSDTVKFNGTTATVTAATTNQLTTTVPSGATTGPISVTVGTSTATSSSNFTVLTVPVITSVSPTVVQNPPTTSAFTVSGSNLTGASFSFVPTFTPAAITVSNVSINGNGTSATMTLTLAANASGSFTVVATNGTGSSSSVPTASNTLGIVSADPFADFDGDGLTNIYESAIGTNYVAASTTGDGLPDGWALFYTGTPPLNAGLAGQTAPNGKTYLASFQQGLNPLLNTVAPSVQSVFPANGATNYPTNGVIVVRFTEPLQGGVSLSAAQSAINAALPSGSNFSASNASAAAQVLQAYLNRTCCGTTAVPGSVQVLQNGKPVNGAVFLSNDRLSITFAPARFFSASTTYTVSVQSVRDAGGNLMAQPFTSTFTTSLTTSVTAPSSIVTTPPNGATGVEINTPFHMEFPRHVNPSTLTLSGSSPTVTVTDSFTGQALSGTLQVDSSLLTASFVPAQPYGVGRTINVTLTTGITDVSGISFLSANKTYSFTTIFAGDSQGATLLATSPADASTGVPLNALVVLEFNEPMDAISALNGLQVQQAGVPIQGAVALSDGNKRITFTPVSQLAANTTYTIVTSPLLTDFVGNPLLNPDASTFTTGSTTDTTHPTVVSSNPPNNQGCPSCPTVPTNALIQVSFSKPIDPITVTSATFTLSESDTAPTEPIVGTVNVSATGLIATFTPSAPLRPFTDFQIAAGSAVTDLEGNTLVAFLSQFTTGGGPVTTPPTIVVSPANGTTGVQVNARIDVLSSAPLSPISAGSGSIQLSASGVNVSGTTSLTGNATDLVFVPSSLLAVNTTYTVTVSGLTDQAGNPIASFTTTFTTGTSGVADTSPVTLVSVSPANGSTGVSVTSNIVLTFNKNIDPNTVSSSSVPISVSGATLAGTYAVSGATITFTPSTQFPGSATILVTVNQTGSITDLVGNPVSTSYSSSFTTASVTDTTAPQVISVTPVNGATGIGLNTAVVLTFSKSLNPNTINTNNFALLADVGNPQISHGTTLTNVSLSHSADNRVVTLKPNGSLFPASSAITVLATSGVQDLSGNALANFRSQFTTAAGFDTTHPSVTTQLPGNGATNVPVSASVVLYVNEAMNTSTLTGALHVSQNGVLVSGTTQITGNGQAIQFTPSSPFPYSTTIQVFLDNTALDVDGNSLTSYQASFTTAANPSTVTPAIVSQIPANGTSGVPTNQTVAIEIAFNTPLNPSTVNGSTANIFDNTSNSGVPATVNLIGGGTVIQLVPNAALQASASFTVTTTNGIQGTNGLSLPSTSRFGFSTGAGPDNVVPTIVSAAPQNGLGNVGDNAQVRVVFSKPINPLTVSASALQLTGGGITEVPDSINFSNNNQTVLLVPHAPLPDATVMTLTISGVTDLAGNAVATQTTQFTTGTGPDLITPIAVAQNPYNGETNVPLNSPIQLRVNDLIDPGTVNSSSMVVTDTTANQAVAGTYSVSADGQTITFVPSALFAASHNISVAASRRGVTNLVNNLLTFINPLDLADFSFTTGTAANTTAPQVTGMSPANGQTGVPINAQVAIQFNEPIDAVTISQVTISGGVSVTSTLINGNQTLILVPVVPLNANTTYTVTVAGVKDIAGNVGATATQSFTTGPGADVTQPAVASVSPTNNATGVLRNSVIQLQFNKPIDPFTVTNSTFTVTPSGSNQQPIAGTITMSANGLTATFTPATTLAASTTYNVSATIGIMDLEGQPLNAPGGFGSSFTTGTQ